MALIGALAQAPQFPVGWMLRYKVSELDEVIRAISDAIPFPSLLQPKPVTWNSISALVHSALPDEHQKQFLAPKFASFWDGLAQEFLSDAFRDEYNSLKQRSEVATG
jgi:hypothetical protein